VSNGHSDIDLNAGYVYGGDPDTVNCYVALQVL
jgi:hypothetical protein